MSIAHQHLSGCENNPKGDGYGVGLTGNAGVLTPYAGLTFGGREMLALKSPIGEDGVPV